MKKAILFLSLIILFVAQGQALAKESHWVFLRADGFTVPEGSIAYLGCTYSPRRIMQKDSPVTALRTALVQIPPADRAVSEIGAALAKRATLLKLPLEPVVTTPGEQRELFEHIFEPKKYKGKPRALALLCGDKPYALIGIVDYYGTFGCQVQIREQMVGNKIDYWRQRSILEREEDSRYRKVGAFEFFLLSAKDGSLLWQANGVEHIEHLIFNSCMDTANKTSEHVLKDLMQITK